MINFKTENFSVLLNLFFFSKLNEKKKGGEKGIFTSRNSKLNLKKFLK
jgi:hypothetical protein